jgi:hypothetical protein
VTSVIFVNTFQRSFIFKKLNAFLGFHMQGKEIHGRMSGLVIAEQHINPGEECDIAELNGETTIGYESLYKECCNVG